MYLNVYNYIYVFMKIRTSISVVQYTILRLAERRDVSFVWLHDSSDLFTALSQRS